MGYCIESAVELTIDGIESQELENDVMDIIDSTLETLRETEFLIKIDQESSFINDIIFYLDIMNTEVTEHPELGKLIKFKGEYELEDYLYDYDSSVTNPFEILELLILGFHLSKEMEDVEVKLGIGDMEYFWIDLTLLNGEIVEINCEENDDESEEWYFKTNESEIQALFKCFQSSVPDLR